MGSGTPGHELIEWGADNQENVAPWRVMVYSKRGGGEDGGGDNGGDGGGHGGVSRGSESVSHCSPTKAGSLPAEGTEPPCQM